MIRHLLLVAIVALPACRDTADFDVLQEEVSRLQAAALQDDTVWQLLESLTGDVGSRMGGSEGDAKAVAWAEEKMLELGFDRVWLEPVDFPRWVRRSESGSVTGPEPVVLDLTALGGSPGTDGALRGEIVHFQNLEALEAAEEEMVTGKIAFISERMVRSRDGAGYGKTVRQRRTAIVLDLVLVEHTLLDGFVHREHLTHHRRAGVVQPAVRQVNDPHMRRAL